MATLCSHIYFCLIGRSGKHHGRVVVYTTMGSESKQKTANYWETAGTSRPPCGEVDGDQWRGAMKPEVHLVFFAYKAQSICSP